jgi:hypothetical protein
MTAKPGPSRTDGGSVRGYHELKTSLDCSGPWLQSCGQSTGLYFYIAAYVENSLFCRDE